MKKRLVALILSVLMLTALLSAFGSEIKGQEIPDANQEGDSAGVTPNGQTETADQNAAPKHIENLVIGTTSEIDTLSIMSESGAFGKFNYNSIIYANFFFSDENNEIQPYFLDSYEISEDGYELKMTFPTTAVWHDGKPVTVEDVIFTFEYRRDVLGSSLLKENLVDIRKDSDNQITLVFNKPKAYYFVKNSTLTVYVLPKHIWENIDDPTNYTGKDAAIGCGPYRLVNVDTEAGVLSYEAVPENSYLGELTVDAITLKSYSSQSNLMMAMANNEIDLMYAYALPVNYSLLSLVDNEPNIDIGASAYAGCDQVSFALTREANGYKEFREAAIKAVNWKLLANLCNGEYGKTPGSGILPSACAGYDPSLWMMYQDQEEAAALLDQAGFTDSNGDGWRELPDGTEFTYKVAAQYSAQKKELFARYGEVIVDSLKKVGINTFYDTVSCTTQEGYKQLLADIDYDMFIGYTTTGIANYRTCFFYFLPRTIVGASASAPKWGETNTDPDVVAAYAKLQGAKDNDEYISAVRELQKLASEKLFGFAICWEQCFYPYRTDKYEGFQNIDSIGVVHCETFYNLTAK